jgi:4-amino-4-deoxy-L-arabinose transferase-like glycosyltransferase
VAILSVAVGLRLWRISWGIAEEAWFPEEETRCTARAAKFVPLSWASFDQRDLTYPTVYGYLAGFATAGAHALGLGDRNPTAASASTLLITRAVSAFAGVLTVCVVALIGARAYSPGVGIAAAGLMAVVPFHVMHSHIAATDVTLTFFCALVLLASLRLTSREASWTSAALAGGAAGLSFATKYTGLAMLVPVGWAVLERAIARRSPAALFGFAIVVLVSFSVMFLVACPPCVIHADRLLAAMRYVQFVTTTEGHRGWGNSFLASTLGWYGRPYLYQLWASLPFSLGWPLYSLALVGLCVAFARHQMADRVVLAALLPYFAIIGRSQAVFPRYLLPLLPVLVVLAARAAFEFRWRRTSLALLGGVWLYTLGLSASHVARFSSHQQEALARWIAANARRDARGLRAPGPIRVGVFYLAPTRDYFRLRGPLERLGMVEVRLKRGQWFADAPDVIVLPEWLEIAIRRDFPELVMSRDLTRLQSGAAGYGAAARWRSSYLQRDFYTWLDPAFAGDLWEGEVGFTVYLRAP